MPRIAVSIILVVCLSPAAHLGAAEDDPAMELSTLYIQRRNEAENWRDNVLAVYVEKTRGIVEELVGHELTADEESRLRLILKESLQELVPESLWEQEMAAVFRRHLSNDEIEEALAFYSTPVGQKFLEIQTKSSAEAGQAIAKVIREGREEFVSDVRARIMETFSTE